MLDPTIYLNRFFCFKHTIIDNTIYRIFLNRHTIVILHNMLWLYCIINSDSHPQKQATCLKQHQVIGTGKSILSIAFRASARIHRISNLTARVEFLHKTWHHTSSPFFLFVFVGLVAPTHDASGIMSGCRHLVLPVNQYFRFQTDPF